MRQIRNILPLKQLRVHLFTKANIRKRKNIGKKASHLSYGEKVDLIKTVFVPEKNFRFPKAIRPFKYEWLLLFPWLCCSHSENASYCLSCVLFDHDFPPKASRAKDLFQQPLRAWSSAASYFRAYRESKKGEN